MLRISLLTCVASAWAIQSQDDSLCIPKKGLHGSAKSAVLHIESWSFCDDVLKNSSEHPVCKQFEQVDNATLYLHATDSIEHLTAGDTNLSYHFNGGELCLAVTVRRGVGETTCVHQCLMPTSDSTSVVYEQIDAVNPQDEFHSMKWLILSTDCLPAAGESGPVTQVELDMEDWSHYTYINVNRPQDNQDNTSQVEGPQRLKLSVSEGVKRVKVDGYAEELSYRLYGGELCVAISALNSNSAPSKRSCTQQCLKAAGDSQRITYSQGMNELYVGSSSSQESWLEIKVPYARPSPSPSHSLIGSRPSAFVIATAAIVGFGLCIVGFRECRKRRAAKPLAEREVPVLDP